MGTTLSAHTRADADERAGDLGSARSRLASYVVTTDYDPETCERIARLSLRMGDLTEAGRWYFLSDSTDAAADDCIHRFKRRHGFVHQQILSALPRSIVTQVQRGRATSAVSKRLHDCGLPPLSERRATQRQHASESRLIERGCFAVIVAIIILALIGFGTLVYWLVP